MTGMSVPDPAFAGDDGRPDPALVGALAARSVAAVQAAMVGARVFVPLVALLGEPGTSAEGLRTDKAARAVYAEDAVALLVDPSGPDSVVLFGAVLLALAEGREWLAPLEDPEVRHAIARQKNVQGCRPQLEEADIALDRPRAGFVDGEPVGQLDRWGNHFVEGFRAKLAQGH